VRPELRDAPQEPLRTHHALQLPVRTNLSLQSLVTLASVLLHIQETKKTAMFSKGDL
jgi:hypothetical protein